MNVTTPAGGEVAAKLDDAVRQLKGFLATFLAISHDDTGALKSAAVTLASIANDVITYAKIQNVSATDKVLGRATAGSGDIEEIACTAAARSILDDATVADIRTTLGLGAVALLASIATGNIADDAVTAVKLASDAVTTVKILDANVTAAKIADGAITNLKVSKGTGTDAAPHLLALGDSQSTAREVTIAGVLSAVISGNTLVFSLAATPTGPSSGTAAVFYASIAERASSGTSGGASVAGGTFGATPATVNVRGTTVTWAEIEDSSDIIAFSTTAIQFKKAGSYKIYAVVPGCNGVGFHKACFGKVAAAGGAFTTVLVGTSSESVAGATTHSIISGTFRVAADNDLYEIRHFTQNVVATNGLGRPASSGEQEIYTHIDIFKV